ncbi:MAG: hypothetical protein U5J63_12330 [Fodinibius sp.]|nr:hypothetical protein [Fodinibius sp.]
MKSFVKPTVSANADDTFRISQDERASYHRQLFQVFENRPFLVQPFMNHIIEEGEFSVFFFDDTYSHTILKKPATADFRVQEEHGGTLKQVGNPAEKIASICSHPFEHPFLDLRCTAGWIMCEPNRILLP